MADIIGAAELQKALQEKADAIVNAAGRAIDESAESMRDDMRRHVPVDTGTLRDAVKVRRSAALIREVGVTDTKAYYGRFIEHGTSTRPARPFILPAAERERRKYPQRVADAINKELT